MRRGWGGAAELCVLCARLTDPQVDVIEEEATQDLVQGPVHLQPSGSSHQPLQQLLQLLRHMLRRNRTAHQLQLCSTYASLRGFHQIRREEVVPQLQEAARWPTWRCARLCRATRPATCPETRPPGRTPPCWPSYGQTGTETQSVTDSSFSDK